MAPEPFRNEPFTDFTDDRNVQEFQAALQKVEGQLGRTYPLIIGGERVETGETFQSINPSQPDQVIGIFAKAGEAEAERAIQAAWKAFETWSRTPFEDRAEVLFRAAALMRERKHEFSAWMVLETGKTWPEADGDTAESIDFLEFYGREMLRYGPPQPVLQLEGEENHLRYIPLGVGAVIPPWNFPNAILTGMTTAPMVCGNTLVLKPSSDAPGIAHAVFALLEEAGMPPGVVNLITGPGSLAGRALVNHPRIRFVTFTGSKEVGLEIYANAAKVAEGQIWLKRVVAEMGGKDGIVVAEDANLDEAAAGIVAAAYGFQGQKCSACSRAIVVDSVYDEVLERVIARTGDIKVGDPREHTTNMGPVINESARDKIQSYMEVGKSEGRLVAGGGRADGEGWFLQPTIVADVDPEARLSLEEIFGPVLAFIRAKDWDDAMRIANNTEYGLTGAVYTQDPVRIQQAVEEFHVGNLYINRKCTGALVAVHPFGGFNMSGTDSKAGGSDYLLQFLQAKSIAKKVG